MITSSRVSIPFGHTCDALEHDRLKASTSAVNGDVADLLKGECLHVNVICSTFRAGVCDEHSGRLLVGVRVAASLQQQLGVKHVKTAHCQ